MHPELLALLTACKESPDDDPQRLVLADWLEEHGEGDRADCVRLSCRLARMHRSDAPRHRYDCRAQALWTTLNDPRGETAAWLRRLRAMLPDVELYNGLLRVGQPTQLLERIVPAALVPWLETLRLRHIKQLYGGDLLKLARQGWLAPFTALDFRQTSETGHTLLALLLDSRGPPRGHLAHVARLDFYNNHLNWKEMREVMAAWDRLPALRSLAVGSNTALGDEGVQALAGSPLLGRLTSLDVTRVWAGPASLVALVQSPRCRRLQSLDLTQNALGREGLEALVDAPGLGSLRRLDLAHTNLGKGDLAALRRWPADRLLEHLGLATDQVGDEAADDLAASPLLAALRSLDISGWKLSAAGLRTLLGALPAGRLQRLNLSGCALSAESAAVLADSPALCGLRELMLDRTGINAEGLNRLASSPHLRNLVYLDLASNRLGAAGMRALCGWTAKPRKSVPVAEEKSRPLPGLRALQLSWTNPTKAGVEALAQSALLGQLEVLHLSRNRLGPAGAAALVASAGLKTLRHLHLSDCHLRDEGVRHLAGAALDHLLGLDLERNRISDEGMRRLADAAGMPELVCLTARSNDVSDAGAEALLGRRPDGWGYLNLYSDRLSPGMRNRLCEEPTPWFG
jgi:uncharacterized protein (TIGR02996 family)